MYLMITYPIVFSRSMFVLLDSLKEETSTTKTVTSQWLTHIVQRSDISRVFVPLLLMLLHPDTARYLYFSIQSNIIFFNKNQIQSNLL